MPTPCASRRAALALAAATAALLAAGCATLNSASFEVATYGTWSASQQPGSYRIERLPSQAQEPGPELQAMEAAVSQVLQTKGFTPAAAGAAPDYTVQIGARISRSDRAPWDNPLWWHAWGPRWSTLAWYQPGWYWGWGGGGLGWAGRYERTEYLREVGVLLRERASGSAVYEARAHGDGITQGSARLLGAMAGAAIGQFPQVQSQPQQVRVTLD